MPNKKASFRLKASSNVVYHKDLSYGHYSFRHCLNKTKPRLPDLETAVNSVLENLRKWLIANTLRLNVAKTEFIPIGSKPMSKIFLIRIRMFH